MKTIMEVHMEGKSVISGTGRRSLILNPPEYDRVFNIVCGGLERRKVNHPNLFGLWGGSEGADALYAFACKETKTPYGIILPTPEHGEYYWCAPVPGNKSKGSKTGTDQREVFKEMCDGAVHVDSYPGKQMQNPQNGRWGYQNYLRNQYMVDHSHLMLVWDPSEGGTKDCFRRIKEAGRAYHIIT